MFISAKYYSSTVSRRFYKKNYPIACMALLKALIGDLIYLCLKYSVHAILKVKLSSY